MRLSFIILLGMLFSISSIAQSTAGYWNEIDVNQLPENEEISISPEHFAAYQLNYANLKNVLQTAPQEGTLAAKNNPLIISIPLPNGTIEEFQIWESSVMHPNLAAKFPNIKSYKGNGIQDTRKVIRFSTSPKGFHGAMQTLEGDIYIDPYLKHQTQYYASYYTRHDHVGHDHQCGVGSDIPSFSPEDLGWDDLPPVADVRDQGGPVDLYEYRIAIACTGEFSLVHGDLNGPSVELSMAAINTGLERFNLIYEQELAMRMTLVENNDELLYIDPLTDPFIDGTSCAGLLGQNSIFLDLNVGAENFDVGHIFTGGCEVGGIASGPACGTGKARGVTGNSSANIVSAVVNIMTHEVGHQFSAGHTWNACSVGTMDQYASGTSYEPGSGSTIMSYSGACSGNNIMGFNLFHVGSLDQMYRFSREGPADCAIMTTTDNNLPDVSIPLEEGFHIPISTPFELTAEATDPDEDPMTYSWEQYDLGPSVPLGSASGNSPLFRSLPPLESPTRVFPRLNQIINNNLNNPEEILPTYTRDLTFRVTVRDNNPLVGGVIWEEIAFHASEEAGPFLVNYPNGGESVEVGSGQEVTWDVANTTASPVNCQGVNIRLSLDGGFTYPITLASNVVNDGSHIVIIPDEVTSDARIRIDAADNIFFDISNNNFTIVPASQAGYSLDVTPTNLLACPPDVLEIEMNTASILNFNESIAYTLSNVPAGVEASISPNPVMPGENSILSLDITNASIFDVQTIQIEANAPGTDAQTRDIQLNLIDTDFSAFELIGPLNGTTGLSGLPLFSWTDMPNADSYEIEIAANPDFAASNILETAIIENGNTYDATTLIENGTPYYWRVRPINICGPAPYSESYALFTQVFSCAEFESNDVPINLPVSNGSVVFSSLNVPVGGQISDVNVTNIKGEYDIVKFIDVKLVSPEETEVVLFSDLACNAFEFDLGFDDQGNPVPCPPSDGLAAAPMDDMGGLSQFNGEDSEGEWKVRVEIINNLASGGQLTNWGLEICANVVLNGPELVNNNKLFVPYNSTKTLENDQLLSEDPDNTASELLYTLVNSPIYGNLYLNGTIITAGDTFTQQDIDDDNITYEHMGPFNGDDRFTFTVTDGEGGWFGTPSFRLEIGMPVSTSELKADQSISLFPNPTRDLFNVIFKKAVAGNVAVNLYNVHGQLLLNQELRNISEGQQIEMNTDQLSSGVYLFQVASEEGTFTKKVTVQK